MEIKDPWWHVRGVEKRIWQIKSDLLDEHDKWFCNLSSDQKPEDYPEWYNSWMDTKHGMYVLYVSVMVMHPNLISLRLMLNPLPASLKTWCESKG
jgi:hypothetical protein